MSSTAEQLEFEIEQVVVACHGDVERVHEILTDLHVCSEALAKLGLDTALKHCLAIVNHNHKQVCDVLWSLDKLASDLRVDVAEMGYELDE